EELKDLLPVDMVPGGFDTSAEALHFSSYLLANYVEAADRVLDAAVAGGPRPAQIKRRADMKTDTRRQGVSRNLDDDVAIFDSDLSSNIQNVLWSCRVLYRVNYLLRFSASATHS